MLRTPSGFELVWVPAGQFLLGSSKEDIHRIQYLSEDSRVPVTQDDVWDESNQIKVTFKSGYWMSRLEITQSQWKAVMGNNPSYWQGAKNRLGNDEAMPVEQVTWQEVQEFLLKVNERGDGFTYRLPSESEWEYAARAGTTGDYAGNLDEMAWYANNSGEKHLDVYKIYAATTEPYFGSRELWQKHLGPNRNQPHPVGGKKPNAWGLYDTHGNVWEWVDGTGTIRGYPTNFPNDGSSNLSRAAKAGRVLFGAVIRGGAYHSPAWACRSAERDDCFIQDRFNTIGFRLVATRK
jgi:formylglycine-generating enzyme required for sulfatase activity